MPLHTFKMFQLKASELNYNLSEINFNLKCEKLQLE